ncbi:large subunit ribosomal protein L14 [Naegleria gruberi]|uniref:Large subunit ribosomal protein L14 n=1 Tax=Naegleria gruberi TaxID=5762 RepID=D2VNY5_NAEGR|nr:large subunit ribosomal protein L14 [Naegleria gruberi]EFC41501.1 large subunit ribosomal protein L14 [Naegleria gruberi]|eukprot:XP_002674245.1 large subunit ribosomal protein L14 [Naegleria gruberi strain NEG-M]
MPSKLFSQLLVQIGRPVVFSSGANKGKLAVIVDILDANRVLVEGEQIPRHIACTGDIQLVNALAAVTSASTTEEVVKAAQSSEVQSAYLASPLVKLHLKRVKRQNLTDFDRVKVQILKKKKNALIREKLSALVQKNGSEVVKKLAAKNAPLKQ